MAPRKWNHFDFETLEKQNKNSIYNINLYFINILFLNFNVISLSQ